MKRKYSDAFTSAITGALVGALANKLRRASTSRTTAPIKARTRGAKRVRFARSFTKTKRRRRNKKAKDNQLTSGGDVTGFTHRVRGVVSKKKLQYVSAVNKYRCFFGQRLVVGSGQQGFDILGYDGAAGNFTVAGIYGVSEIGGIRATLTAAGFPAIPNALQFAVPKAKAEYAITNSTNGNIIVWLYDIIPRKDIQSTDTMVAYPYTAWVNGAKVQAGTSANSPANPGSKPFESKIFCEYYKVKKVTKVTMAPGALHRHVVRSVQRRWFTDSMWSNLWTSGGGENSSTLWMHGRSVLTMILIMGGPAHNAAAADSAHTTSSPAAVDITTTKTYEYLYSYTGARQVLWSDTTPAGLAVEAVPEAGGGFGTIVTN